MIIKRLAMYNFGVYAGENTFEFSLDKPVVLIGGMNGRGKTTFLEAILLSLYGSNSNAYKESGASTYGQYLRNHINKSSWDRRAYVEMTFVQNENIHTEYTIHREWDAHSKRTTESIDVKENGVCNEFLTQNWNLFIENIVPYALSSFYFFDGEKIAELALDDSNEQIKHSIRSMLGLTILDVLKNDLGKSIKKNSRVGASQNTVELLRIQQEKEELTNALAKKEQELATIREQISSAKSIIEELHRQYEIKGGNMLKQHSALMQKRADLQAEMEQNREQLIELTASELPLIMVINLIRDIKMQAEDEHHDFIMQQSIEQIEIFLQKFLSENKDAAVCREFVDYIKSQTTAEGAESVYKVSDYALFQLNTLLDSTLETSRQAAKTLLAKEQELQKKLDDIESHLSIDVNETEIAQSFSTIRKKEADLVRLQVVESTLLSELSSLQFAVDSKVTEYNRTVEVFLAQVSGFENAERLTKYANMALRIIDAYSVKVQKQKTDLLGATITSCYRQLANKKNLIREVRMDAVSLEITYYDNEGTLIPKLSLSAGEKQLMVIAVLWALAICSKKKLPVIIDTPLSRLDSAHRTSLVKNYFPHASEQTIILSTDSEIDHNYYELLKHAIGDEFTLQYDDTTRSTSILKGYFQKP